MKTNIKDSWGTPQYLIDHARLVMISIDCDPASNKEAQERVNASTFYTIEENGLTMPWHGNVWLNPPYSQPLVTQFTEKLLEEIKLGNTKKACVLLNNSTDTKHVQSLLRQCAAVLLLDKRVAFIPPGSKTPQQGTRQGQILLYFGFGAERFCCMFKKFGWVSQRSRMRLGGTRHHMTGDEE